jgi:anti-anti-sigma regulatory factor
MMSLKGKKAGATQVLEISGSLTVGQSAELKKAIQGSLKKSKELQLVIKQVDEVDLSFLQVIAAAIKSAESENKKFVFQFPVPDQVLESVILGGLQNHGSCQAESCLWCLIEAQGPGA